MSKNWKAGRVDTGLSLPLAVSEHAVAGDVTHAGGTAAQGLYGYLLMPPEGASHIANVRLLPTEGVVELKLAENTATAGDKVYSKIDSSAVKYSKTGTSTNYHIGHVVNLPGRTPETAYHAFVYLGTATGVKGA